MFFECKDNQEQILVLQGFLLLSQYLFLKTYTCQDYKLQPSYIYTKKLAVMTRTKLKTISLQVDKKSLLNNCQNSSFLLINSNNQELIHQIHYLGYIFYYQSRIKKFC